MKPSLINDLDNFIAGWYIDPTICDEIIEYHNKSENKLLGETSNGYDVNIKDSLDVPFLFAAQDLQTRYMTALTEVMAEYKKKYEYCTMGMPWIVNQSPIVQYYPPNGGYKVWHSERLGNSEPHTSRHLVFMTYLNDVTDAGETEWFHQSLKVKPEKGLTVIWPADWTFTHRGIPSPSQEKYIITGWYNYFNPYQR
jgi:hypothetical protein